MDEAENLQLKNQYGDPNGDYYAAVCVIKKDEVRFFDTDHARRDAWKWADKHGGVVMITMKDKRGGEVDVFPDKRPDDKGARV